MKNLTNYQRELLIAQYVEIVVNDMSHGSLVDYAIETMEDYHERLSDNELIETIDCYHPDLYNELLDKVAGEYDAASYT